jgi:hypothetical protein
VADIPFFMSLDLFLCALNKRLGVGPVLLLFIVDSEYLFVIQVFIRMVDLRIIFPGVFMLPCLAGGDYYFY